MKKTKEKTPNPVGRPLEYATPQELQEKIDDYFVNGVAQRKVMVGPSNNRQVAYVPVPTITGLVLHCGFCNRASFYDYEERPKFSNTIKKARTMIEMNYEELLQCGGGAGAIFALKNFGWTDKLEIATDDIFKGKLQFEPDPVPIPQNRIKEFLN